MVQWLFRIFFPRYFPGAFVIVDRLVPFQTDDDLRLARDLVIEVVVVLPVFFDCCSSFLFLLLNLSSRFP